MSEQKINSDRFCGVLLHPSSLPNSGICGTFGTEARTWLKYLAKNEIAFWQFLPLAPTDSSGSPYSSPSSFAINPWFLDAHDLVDDGYIPKISLEVLPGTISSNKKLLDFGIADDRSNALGKLLRESWHLQSPSRQFRFAEWCDKQFWLEDHSMFMELRKQNNRLPWWQWPKHFALREMFQLNKWKYNNNELLLEHKLIQWHLHLQWQRLKKISNELGIFLMGDIPFYVSRDSADVWSNKTLFSVNSEGRILFQSGVPPDYFSETGQLWGTPVYRWNKHKRTHFRWWRERIKRQWQLVDLLRLDHFRAFSGFWKINGDQQTAQDGFWSPSPGLHLLNLLRRDCGGKLPLIAEDLGVITDDVEILRNYFKLPGMKILQFAFDGNNDNPYLPENIHDYRSIVYTGTHDNSTTYGWWLTLNDSNRSNIIQKYGGDFVKPYWRFIEIGLNTNTLLFIAPIQDLLGLDNKSRFNTPGTIRGNWSWRLEKFDSCLIEALENYNRLSKRSGRIFHNLKSSVLSEYF